MSFLHRAQSPVYVLFRIIVGLMFACHGLHKLFGVFTGAGPLPAVGEWPDWWAAVIELAGGLLVAFGLATRFAAIICAGAMAYAYFVVHQPGGALPIQNHGESAVLYCWAMLVIACMGSGRWSVDAAIRATVGNAGSEPEGARSPAST